MLSFRETFCAVYTICQESHYVVVLYNPSLGLKTCFCFLTLDHVNLFVLFLWQARTNFVAELEKTEDWLYEEGDDQSKKVYQEKLDALKVT